MTLISATRIHGLVAALLIAAAAPSTARAQQMPDPRTIAGVPLPVGDVANGTVVVRVIRGSLSNNIPDQKVDLLGADRTTQSVTTDATGRAQFTGLKAGLRVTAVTSVGGERLQSQEFAVPATGGVRLLLVATDPDQQKQAERDRELAAGPAQPGSVALGGESRFVFEMGDGSLSVFNLFHVLNTARTPVQTTQPIVFDLPRGATGAAMLQDSSPQAELEKTRVVVKGPIAPGTTVVQFAYSMPYSSDTLRIEQKVPAPLGRVIVLAQKVGDMRLSSPKLSEQREMTAEGQAYIVAQGPAVGAGDTIAFDFSNLPHAPLWPRNVALALAVAVLAVGAWAAAARRGAEPSGDRRRNQLETKRGQLFAELTAVERQHREGRIDPQRYAARRAELVAALERVYAEIDRQAA
ncbi:MAG TPA: hypothetical protein VH740_27045 [Vicinamibacterales bacterium]|jgi:hypothetical protein